MPKKSVVDGQPDQDCRPANISAESDFDQRKEKTLDHKNFEVLKRATQSLESFRCTEDSTLTAGRQSAVFLRVPDLLTANGKGKRTPEGLPFVGCRLRTGHVDQPQRHQAIS